MYMHDNIMILSIERILRFTFINKKHNLFVDRESNPAYTFSLSTYLLFYDN